MTLESQPPIGWRYCGDQLKRWRQRAGISREELAKEACVGVELIKSIEQGRRRASLRILQVADQLCGAGGLLEAAYQYLQPEPQRPAAHDFFRYEEEAIARSACEPVFIPGLLQTERTARALFAKCWPPVDDQTIDERVTRRLSRQYLLDKQMTAFSFIIGDAPLRYPVADVESHREQLRRLLEVGSQRNVTIQVMPAGALQLELNGSLVVLELPDRGRIAYHEGSFAGALITDPEEVRKMAHRLALIHQLALSPGESTRVISSLLRDCE
ncbi:helix-turn-helix transcriptional regulator [Streptomyces sp. NPDC049555]|uniref:helix-turn-helix domain-containing protein n=1 Tax=Streptomyces sp. NPDC049555 TaxID=3154930 RepID=UPI00342F425A